MANAGDARGVGLIPGLGRSPGEGNGNPFVYSCLSNSMDRGAWRATVHGVAKSWTQLSTHTHTQLLGVDEETQSTVNTLLYPNVIDRIV